jgi:hypothetical protein
MDPALASQVGTRFAISSCENMNSPDQSLVPSTHHSESRGGVGGNTAFSSESRVFKSRTKGSYSEVRLSFPLSKLVNGVKYLKLGL